MRSHTHEAVGVAVTLSVCAVADSGVLVAAGAVCASLLGSRLPDADQLGARIHRRIRLERRSLAAAVAGATLRLPMTLFAAVARHRAVTHWLLSGAVVTLLLAALAAAAWPPLALPVALGTGCGYVAHVLADACTPHGAPLLGPFSARRVHLLPAGHRIITGGRGDLLLAITVSLSAGALVLAVLQSA